MCSVENCMDEISSDERELFHAYLVVSTGLGIFYTRRNDGPGMENWAKMSFSSARLTMKEVDLSRVRETTLQLLGFQFIGNEDSKRKWQLPLWSIFAFPHDMEVVCCNSGKRMKISDCDSEIELASGNKLCTPYYIEIKPESWALAWLR